MNRLTNIFATAWHRLRHQSVPLRPTKFPRVWIPIGVTDEANEIVADRAVYTYRIAGSWSALIEGLPYTLHADTEQRLDRVVRGVIASEELKGWDLR